MVNSHLVCDPTIRQPGFDLPLQQWSLINRFHMKQGHCLACRRRWRLTNTYLCLLVKFIKHNQNYYLKSLTFRTLSEAYIRKSWYSVLPVLDTTERRRVKKAVVCVAQLVAVPTVTQDLHRRNWKEIWSQITGTQDWSGIQNRTNI